MLNSFYHVILNVGTGISTCWTLLAANRDGLHSAQQVTNQKCDIYWSINAEPCHTIVMETGFQTRRENNGVESLYWGVRGRKKSFVFGVQIVTEWIEETNNSNTTKRCAWSKPKEANKIVWQASRWYWCQDNVNSFTGLFTWARLTGLARFDYDRWVRFLHAFSRVHSVSCYILKSESRTFLIDEQRQ